MERNFRMPDPSTGKTVALDMDWVRWAVEVGGDPFRVAFAVDACRALMDANGLGEWGLDVTHARVRAACMRYSVIRNADGKFWNGKPGSIVLSGPLMSLWDDVQQIRIILHEIAHAMCPDDGHGAVWRAYCRKLGIKPERCYGNNGEKYAPRKPRKPRAPSAYYWVGSCPGGHAHRREIRPSRRLACLTCSRVPDERFVITWRRVKK